MKRLIKRASAGANTIGMFVLLTMMLVTTCDALGRYILNKPIPGAFELATFMLATFILLGIAYTEQVNGHVAVTLFIYRMPPRVRLCVNVIMTIFTLAFFAVITWRAWELAGSLRQKGLTSDILDIPAWPFRLLLALGAFLMCLELLTKSVNYVRELMRR